MNANARKIGKTGLGSVEVGLALAGVTGTALGECAGKPCIKVFVVKKTPELLQQIPSSIEGYPLAIRETGEIGALER